MATLGYLAKIEGEMKLAEQHINERNCRRKSNPLALPAIYGN